MRSGACRTVALLALLGVWATGCTTDVVEFRVNQTAADAAPDGLHWSCTMMLIKPGYRCAYCTHSISGATRKECESLECKSAAYGDIGISGCKYCWWTNHPKDFCKICWGAKTLNTCSGDAGP